jgi:hypothetical protein
MFTSSEFVELGTNGWRANGLQQYGSGSGTAMPI